MEWNLGPGKYKEDPNHNHFRTALMQSEIQMQFMQAGMEIASLWSTQWPDDNESDFRFLVSSSNNYQPTPSSIFFKLYKHALNGKIVQSSSTHAQIMTTSVIIGKKAYVYLLNKADEAQEVNDYDWDLLCIYPVPDSIPWMPVLYAGGLTPSSYY